MPSPRRAKFLSLAGQIESQLRDAYARKYCKGEVTQTSIANKLGINRSAVHHRLMGRTNMTIETIADMVWALDHDITVRIYDPTTQSDVNEFYPAEPAPPPRPRRKTPTESSDKPISQLELA
jgi:hypothetical protein